MWDTIWRSVLSVFAIQRTDGKQQRHDSCSFYATWSTSTCLNGCLRCSDTGRVAISCIISSQVKCHLFSLQHSLFFDTFSSQDQTFTLRSPSTASSDLKTGQIRQRGTAPGAVLTVQEGTSHTAACAAGWGSVCILCIQKPRDLQSAGWRRCNSFSRWFSTQILWNYTEDCWPSCCSVKPPDPA